MATTELQPARAACVQGQMQRHETLAALGRRLAGVAHEVNSPMSHLHANTHALERYAPVLRSCFGRVGDGADPAELARLRETLRLDRALANLREAVQGPREGAEGVRDIVAGLRHLSPDGTDAPARFEQVEVARSAASRVQRGRARSVVPVHEGASSLPVSGHAGHVRQMVMTRVQTARDGLDGRPQGRVTPGARSEAGRALREVRDTGPGIGAALGRRIFEPFFTTRPVGQGTGPGLAIGRRLAQEHGGALRLCPGVAEGAGFRLDLPLAPPVPAPGAA